MTKHDDNVKNDVLRETFTPKDKTDMRLAAETISAIVGLANKYGLREGGNHGSDALMILTAAHFVLSTSLAGLEMPMEHAEGCIAFGQALGGALLETGVVLAVEPGKVA